MTKTPQRKSPPKPPKPSKSTSKSGQNPRPPLVMSRPSPPSKVPSRPVPRIGAPRKGGLSSRIAMVALLVIAVTVVGLVVLRSSLSNDLDLPLRYSDFDEAIALVPNNTYGYIVGRVDTIERIIGLVRQALPVWVNGAEQTAQSILFSATDMQFLSHSDEWLGSYATLSLFPQSEGQTSPEIASMGYLVTAQIDDPSHSAQLYQQLSQIASPAGTAAGFTQFRFADDRTVLLSDHTIALTNAGASLPPFAGTSSLKANEQFRKVFSQMRFAQYDVLLTLQAGSPIWKSLGLPLFQGASSNSTQGYLSIGLAAPEPEIMLIDLAQFSTHDGQMPIIAKASLRAFVPPLSLATIQIKDVKAWHDRFLSSTWINQQIPNLRNLIAQANQVITTVTGVDYQQDLLSWMREDVLLFADTPYHDDPPQALTWGAVVQSSDRAATQRAFDRLDGLTTRVGLLQTLVPSLPFELHSDTIGAAKAITLGLAGKVGAADVQITTLNDGQQFLVGNRYGIQHEISLNSGQSAINADRFAAYTLDNSTLSMMLKADAVQRASQILSDLFPSSQVQSQLNLPDLPFEQLHLDVVVETSGITSVRMVLLMTSSTAN